MGNTVEFFERDFFIAKAIMQRDVKVTLDFMYKECYPMFKALFNQYYTDCQSCKEFIDEIYTIIMTPGVKTGYCPLSNYRGESSLKTWIRNASLSYCYNRFKKRINTIQMPSASDEVGGKNLTIIEIAGSEMMDMSEIYRQDEETIQKCVIQRMPNKRYRELMWLYMIEKKCHKEIAQTMGMTMPNYYNIRKLAKDQYEAIRKEMKL